MPSGWRPAAFNQGWIYRDRVPRSDAGTLVSHWLAERYRHSDGALWQLRIASGELRLNDSLLLEDRHLQGGEHLCWRRPPWLEEAIPDQWETIHDDGDLLVINKPSGLPVMPGGGFLRHTLTALLEPSGARPVHRPRTGWGGSPPGCSCVPAIPRPVRRCPNSFGRMGVVARCIRPGPGGCLGWSWGRP